jgi:hypothetical protein
MPPRGGVGGNPHYQSSIVQRMLAQVNVIFAVIKGAIDLLW